MRILTSPKIHVRIFGLLHKWSHEILWKDSNLHEMLFISRRSISIQNIILSHWLMQFSLPPQKFTYLPSCTRWSLRLSMSRSTTMTSKSTEFHKSLLNGSIVQRGYSERRTDRMVISYALLSFLRNVGWNFVKKKLF